MKALILICLALGLAACQPKGSFLYQYPNSDTHQINQIILVVDYLNLKDDVGKYWDFDSHYHQLVLNQLLRGINTHMQSNGFPAVESYLLSSGLLIKKEFAVEHYMEDEAQEELLYPPFVLAQANTEDQLIEQHQEILGILVKYIAQRRHRLNDELSHRGMQLGYQLESMKIADDTAILYVHIDVSAPGIIKQLGTFLVSGALASQADYAHVQMDATPRRHASAFLVHKGSGQILWKNYSNQWTPTQPIELLLSELPDNSID